MHTIGVKSNTQTKETKLLADNARLKSEIYELTAKLEETKSNLKKVDDESKSVKFKVAQI